MKKKITYYFVLLFVLFTTNVSIGQELEDNLLLHYSFTGNSNDHTVNGFDGTVNATLTSDRLGNNNMAYSFNGVDEFIDFPDEAALKPSLPVSFAFWVKLDDLSPENTVIFTTDFEQNNHSGVWMNLSSTGKLAINYGDASGNTTSQERRTKVGETDLSIDTWYHIVGIVKGANDMELYVNCNNDNGTYQGSGGDLAYTSNPGSIGRKDGNTSVDPYYFKGTLDSFRYWDRAITEEEVNYLCDVTLSTTSTPEIREELCIYPNPTSDFIYLKSTTNLNITKVQITNIIGQIVLEENFESKIDLRVLEPGMYFLKALNENNTFMENIKIIKK